MLTSAFWHPPSVFFECQNTLILWRVTSGPWIFLEAPKSHSFTVQNTYEKNKH
jgi:hypothetical protein